MYLPYTNHVNSSQSNRIPYHPFINFFLQQYLGYQPSHPILRSKLHGLYPNNGAIHHWESHHPCTCVMHYCNAGCHRTTGVYLGFDLIHVLDAVGSILCDYGIGEFIYIYIGVFTSSYLRYVLSIKMNNFQHYTYVYSMKKICTSKCSELYANLSHCKLPSWRDYYKLDRCSSV